MQRPDLQQRQFYGASGHQPGGNRSEVHPLLDQLQHALPSSHKAPPPSLQHAGSSSSAGQGPGLHSDHAARAPEPLQDQATGFGAHAQPVKELLRVFASRVPGSLVPDEAVQTFMQVYQQLHTPADRYAFFQLIMSDLGLSVSEVQAAVQQWQSSLQQQQQQAVELVASSAGGAGAAMQGSGDTGLYRAADKLASAALPLYTRLFLPVSQMPNGLKFLVDMRADLLALAGELQLQPDQAAPLRAMADHLRQALAEWFSVGMMTLQPISWQGSPAELLEKVMRYEAVHPIASWAEMRQRLGPDRRCFAFIHPSMPGEPLVVLHTALMHEPPSDLRTILDAPPASSTSGPQPLQPLPLPAAPPPPAAGPSFAAAAAAVPLSLPMPPPPPPSPPPPSTAVFYSISTSQKGLAGIDLGQFLIKRVAKQIMAEQPSVQELVTLSPLPNFRPWLLSRLAQEQGTLPGNARRGSSMEPEAPLLRPHEQQVVLALASHVGWPAAAPAGDEPTPAASAAAALMWLLEKDRWLTLSSGSSDNASSDSSSGGGVSGMLAAVASMVQPQPPQPQPDDAAGVLRPVLLRLAAHYLVHERRRRLALCPVAHFHLHNGASLWRINWEADMSRLGLRRSCGIMVNYRYDLEAVQYNNVQYLTQYLIKTGPLVQQLLQQ